MKGAPLVSILIPNYNYAKYLHTCLDSALSQTYDNLQVVFVDNQSTDNSYDIALEFRARYKDRIRIYRNNYNIGASQNHAKANSLMDPRTKCYIYLSSDDYFHPTLVQRSMDIITQHPSVGFILSHRNGIDEKGHVTPEIPFYNANCVIASTQQMEVFMMAGIGVSSQCFRKRQSEFESDPLSYHFDISGDWFSNYCLASVSDMGYIKDPLVTYRTHATNETTRAVKNLTNSMEHILMVHAFSDIATRNNHPSVSKRLHPALEKLGTMCLRYCTQLLHEGDPYTAIRYLHLAPVLRPNIREDFSWQTLWRLAHLSSEECQQGLIEFEAASPQKRLVSYDPPEGCIRL